MKKARLSSVKAALERRHAKLIIPTVGLIGVYAGAFLAILALSARHDRPSGSAVFFFECAAGLAAGFAAMIPVDGWLGEKASHVDLLKVPLYWAAAGAALYAGDWVLEKAGVWPIPAFASNLALWFAGVLAIWVEEPKS